MEIARLKTERVRTRMERDILKNQRGLMPPLGAETFLRYLACGRERPSTFWWPRSELDVDNLDCRNLSCGRKVEIIQPSHRSDVVAGSGKVDSHVSGARVGAADHHFPVWSGQFCTLLYSEKTPAGLVQQSDVHLIQITAWKNHLLDGAAGVFGRDASDAPAPDVDLKVLAAKASASVPSACGVAIGMKGKGCRRASPQSSAPAASGRVSRPAIQVARHRTPEAGRPRGSASRKARSA